MGLDKFINVVDPDGDMYVDLEQVRGLFFYGEGARMGGADADGGGQCMFFAGIPGLSTDGSVGLVGACVPSERFDAWPETTRRRSAAARSPPTFNGVWGTGMRGQSRTVPCSGS